MPPPPEIKIKTEVPGNFFNEENMKFLEEVLDEVPSDCVSEADDDELDIDGNNTSKKIVMKIKPEPRSTPSPSSDYRKSPEPIATSIDETKRKTEKKKVEDNQRRTRKSRSRSSSSSRRKRQSPRPRSYIREQPRYRSRSRDKYKSRSPLRKVKRERRSSSEERQKRKQLKRSPCREVRRNRSNSRDRRRSRSNDRRRNNSRSRSKSRDRRRSRSNDRRRDSRGRRSRSPIKKLPFLEEVKKTLAAKGQSSVEIEEFERLQRQKLKMENASQVNSTSVSVPSPVTVPPLPVQQRPSVELPPYGNGMMHVQNSTLPTGGECRNEPSTSKQLHVANPYENIPLPQPIKVKAGGECKHEPSTSKQLHGANPYDNIPLPQPFKVKAEPPDVVSLPDGTTQKIKKEKIDPRYEAIEVMPKAIKVERPAPPAATEKTKVLRLCDDAVNVFEKSDMEKASKSFLYTPTFVITHSEEYADNRSPLNRINNVLFKFNSTNSNIDTKQWGIHMLSENTSKIVRFVGYDVVKLIEKLRNRDIPEQFKMDNKNHNEISGPKYDTPYFTDSSTQTDDYSCGECIARKLKKHVSEGVQAVPLQEDIGCQATPNDELPLMMAIPTLNMSQQLATNDFVELLKGPMPTNSTEMYRLREKLLDIYNIAHRPTMILNTSAYNQTIAPIVNSQSNAFPPIMPMQHQQQLQSQYQNAMPVMLQQLGNNTNNVLAVQQQQQALLQMQQQQQQQHQLQASSNQQLMFQQSNPNAVSYANANRIVPPAPTMHTALNRQIVDPRVNNVDMFRNRSPPIMNNEQNRLESRQAVFGRGGKQIPARNPRPF